MDRNPFESVYVTDCYVTECCECHHHGYCKKETEKICERNKCDGNCPVCDWDVVVDCFDHLQNGYISEEI